MRTSYQEHYYPEESSNVLVVETPAPLEVEGMEEGGAGEGGVEGGADKDVKGDQEKRMEEFEGSECAVKKEDGEEVDSIKKEGDEGEVPVVDEERGDGGGSKGEEDKEGKQDRPPGEVDGTLAQKGGEKEEHKQQPHVRMWIVHTYVRTFIRTEDRVCSVVCGMYVVAFCPSVCSV